MFNTEQKKNILKAISVLDNLQPRINRFRQNKERCFVAAFIAGGIFLIALLNVEEWRLLKIAIGNLGLFALPCIMIGCLGYVFHEGRTIEKIESHENFKLLKLGLHYCILDKQRFLKKFDSGEFLDLNSLEPIK